MNRYLNQYTNAFEKKVVQTFSRITFGASGAPTLDAKNSKGIVNVTRNGAGDFTLVFGTKVGMLDTYVKLLSLSAVFNTYQVAGTPAPAAPGVYIKQNATALVNQSALRLVFLNPAGQATDPAAGEILHLSVTFGDSTAP